MQVGCALGSIAADIPPLLWFYNGDKTPILRFSCIVSVGNVSVGIVSAGAEYELSLGRTGQKLTGR